MVVKRTFLEGVFDVFNAIFMIVLMIVCFYPIWHVVMASFSEPDQLMVHSGPILIPLGFTTKGYELVMQNPNILIGYRNTILYMVTGTIINLLMTSMGAYVISRKRVKFIRPLTLLIMFTMYFSGGLIPWYMIIKSLGMLDTIWAMILPGAISTYNLIVMRTSFLSIPNSLIESAQIDGANDFIVLFKIILPVSKAMMAVMTLFYAVGYWNSWFNASILLKNRELFPLQLILREILIMNDQKIMMQGMNSITHQDMYQSLIKYCSIVVGTVPIFFVYPFLQKHFTKGVMIGSIKE